MAALPVVEPDSLLIRGVLVSVVTLGVCAVVTRWTKVPLHMAIGARSHNQTGIWRCRGRERGPIRLEASEAYHARSFRTARERGRIMTTNLRIAAAVAALLSVPGPARADVVLDWNDLATRTFVTQGQSPFAQARLAAIVQLAVFEAVNAATGEYEPYFGVVAPVNTSAEAAAITAAYRVLETYFPTANLVEEARAASLAGIADGAAKDNGIDVGERAAAAVIASRVDDHASPLTFSVLETPDAGVWQLTQPPGCSSTATGGSFFNWQDVTPFGVPDVQAFIPGPPPDITKNRFAKALDEVKAVGSADSSERSADRSDVARFYAATSPTYAFNLVARQLAAAAGGTLTENARALALLNMSTSDSLVASFATKYRYNFWRPETAIRFTADFGNRKVEADPGFVPFIATPCFPSYPSNHASGSSGAAEILRRIYGEGGHAITMSNALSAPIAGLQFEYSTLNQITSDVDDARVYGGIHFRFDQDAGSALGRAIATYTFKHNLRPLPGNR
jgi:hypothetical protein